MKALYPAALPFDELDDNQLIVKVARHSPCLSCSSCPGLHPSPGVEVVVKDDLMDTSLGILDGYGSDDDDDLSYINLCACGHAAKDHGADLSHINRNEFARRGRVAARLDELLQDAGMLLDFAYVDDDITSLRLQMRLPVAGTSPTFNSVPRLHSQSRPASPASSVLSDLPPNKRRRISMSSLSDDDDEDEDEEDRPLAARMVTRPSRRSGKKGPGYKSKPQTIPPSFMSQGSSANGSPDKNSSHVNGNGTRVKQEDQMDEAQLNRLVTGVTVDTGQPSSAVPGQKVEKAAAVELRKGIIEITAVENDGEPRSFVVLTGLKTLFQKQLPKMPREYIARLVYDSNSKSLAIVKRGLKVVGGICYRPFPHRGFAEIVFFATASVDQVKGYGGMLMDHFKAHIKRTYPQMMHFLTYADNYAVGYFEKQGFSKDITLDRSVWAGYIKDYEGGTIMQCTMVRKVDYLNKAETFAKQTEAILSKIRQMSKSHVVYEGLPQFRYGNTEGVTVDPKDVPGLSAGKWLDTKHIGKVEPVQFA
ncbi:hypothetical protein HGRIS_002573 [Hohenbuehelia grisea]|uniref:N-acetyltransferase domain-containing protein n=1 Tax=Hohenbuehelia grisea TaxID=104357 RepID=A0ABR3JMT0_9AGAR